MNTYLIVAGVILLIILYALINSYLNTQKLKRRIHSMWGRMPEEKVFDKIDSVSKYWKDKLKNKSPKYYIDNITWRDLNMDEVFKRLNRTNSSVGAEYLYAMLHEPKFNIGEMEDLEQLIQKVDANEEIRENIQLYLAKLGKYDYNMVSDFIFSPKDKKLKNDFIYPILASLPIISLLIGFISLRWAVLLFVSSSILNVSVYYKSKYKLDLQIETVKYITSIIVWAGKLAKLKDSELQYSFDMIGELFKPLKKLSGLGRFLISDPSSNFDFLLEYLKVFLLSDYINYNRMINIISKRNNEFYQLWQEIGKLDAAISIASLRHEVSFYKAPVFTDNDDITFEDLYHPLVQKPICNSASLTKDAIITGSNASGKSTFVKAVAINCLFAQTIHTCLASSFCFKPSMIVSSMAVNDNVVEGDSYYIAEIKSLKRVIDMINDDVRCICLIDEILRGTNTIERIAASAAILKYLSQKNCLCIVASHDIELTEILKGIYDNYHFREKITDDGITFDYKIHDGHATTRNAIKLLEFMDYPKDVVKAAQSAAEGFEVSRRW